MKRRPIRVVLLMSLLIGSVLRAQVPLGPVPFKGRLYAAALNGNPAALKPDDANRVPPSFRPRFQRFLTCQSAFRSRLRKPEDFVGPDSLSKNQAVERAIQCLIEAPGIAELATAYAANAQILYEWEGLSSSPLEEAAYAEKYIDEHADSPLKPYLYLFIAQRARYAFEFAAVEKQSMQMTAVAARYRTFIARARQAEPMIALIADDLDALPFVAQDVGRHPKDY